MRQKPQNGLFPLEFRHPAGGGLSHGHRQHAQKSGKNRACGSGDILADRQTDTQTDRRVHHNTLPPLPRAIYSWSNSNAGST